MAEPTLRTPVLKGRRSPFFLAADDFISEAIVDLLAIGRRSMLISRLA
jgi:hypothetical protein